MDMYRVLSESRITVNVHIDVAENFANNMRLYEATGCGALLITEEKDNLANLFRPGEEVVTYRSTDHAVEKIKYYLNRPIEAAAIARAGQQRTLKEHTYRHRMGELTDIFSLSAEGWKIALAIAQAAPHGGTMGRVPADHRPSGSHITL
jgi:spore maturation protein CgeB